MTARSLLGPFLLATIALPAFAQAPTRTIESASVGAASWRDDRSAALTVRDLGGICEIGAMRPDGVNLQTRPRLHYAHGNQLDLPEMSLCQLIAMAYDVPGHRIADAPDWMLQAVRANYYRVHIQAAEPDDLTVDQARELLRALLADRFQLKLHRESRTIPVYELAPGPGGSKLKEDDKNGVTTATYIYQMAKYLDRPIVDKTGAGEAVRFQWFSPEVWGRENGVKPVPELLTALNNQLGLTLKPADDAVEFLVIDRAVQASLD